MPEISRIANEVDDVQPLYELVTAKIVERLEEGVIPWQKCWTSGPAKSLTTGKEYRGLNSLLLRMRESALSTC